MPIAIRILIIFVILGQNLCSLDTIFTHPLPRGLTLLGKLLGSVNAFCHILLPFNAYPASIRAKQHRDEHGDTLVDDAHAQDGLLIHVLTVGKGVRMSIN